MFSSLSKVFGKDDSSKSELPVLEKQQSVVMMDKQMQRKLGKGVNYNMKIILKGDLATGKTSMHNRLQGKPFPAEHAHTTQIGVATIDWNYKATDDVVKVEVWDIVDGPKAGNFYSCDVFNAFAAISYSAASDTCTRSCWFGWQRRWRGRGTVENAGERTKV